MHPAHQARMGTVIGPTSRDVREKLRPQSSQVDRPINFGMTTPGRRRLYRVSMSSPRLSSQRWRLLADAAIAVLLLVLGLAEIWGALPSRDGAGSPLWSSLAVVISTVPLVVRRSHPLLITAVSSVALLILFVTVPIYVLFYGSFVPIAFITFSVARHGQGRAPFYGAAWQGLALVGFTVFVPHQDTGPSIVFNFGFLTMAWVAGWALAVFERRAATARRHAVDTEVAATKLAMAAVLEERTRIARELHDIIAHAVSVIVVQAGAAEPIVEENPDYVRTALETIRSTGVSALAEMRRVVAMLREADDPHLLAPQPGVNALPELIEHARHGGLDASLTLDGLVGPLPTGLDLAVYRIVQEALSNVRRHAAASSAWVELNYLPDLLHVEIRDDGLGAVIGAEPSGGHGLIGMRERAALYGGQLETSTEAGHGFTVRARLPLAAT